MARALRRAGHQAEVFAETIHKSFAQAARPLDLKDNQRWHSRDHLLIYHHSMAWPQGEALLGRTRNQLVVRYHNITPARFFNRYSEEHYAACKLGHESTRRIAAHPRAWFLGDSPFNCRELIQLGAEASRCRALAPFHPVADLAQAPFDPQTLVNYKDGSSNIVFVGGLKPNKGHARAIRAFAEYHHAVNPRSRLVFVGGCDPRLRGYRNELLGLVRSLRLVERVVFTGLVTAAELRSFYTLADVFLCLSEHEGFCVPLVEAMYFRVPIVAWGTTAVGETAGEAGLLWDSAETGLFVESIHAIVERGDLARNLAALGAQRYRQKFHPEVLSGELAAILGQIGADGGRA
jgi:glycosyltransferase involved in cell wall biosynthesis